MIQRVFEAVAGKSGQEEDDSGTGASSFMISHMHHLARAIFDANDVTRIVATLLLAATALANSELEDLIRIEVLSTYFLWSWEQTTTFDKDSSQVGSMLQCLFGLLEQVSNRVHLSFLQTIIQACHWLHLRK